MSGSTKRLLALVVAVVLVTPAAALAQQLDPASSEALAAVLKMLQDPSARNTAIAGNPGAAAADRQLKSIAGSDQLTQEIYQLAAEIFSDLTRASGGDLRKMTEALDRGKGDPSGFAANLSPATLQKLREISVKISDRKR